MTHRSGDSFRSTAKAVLQLTSQHWALGRSKSQSIRSFSESRDYLRDSHRFISIGQTSADFMQDEYVSSSS